MKTKPETSPRDEPMPSYDFRGGTRGKYAAEFAAGHNLILLDEDVAAVFPDAAAVNRALRGLIDVSSRAVAPPKAKDGRRRSAG